MELQETLLLNIKDNTLLPEIKTMMQQVATVHRHSKVPGGILLATVQTSTVSTMVDRTHPTLMVSTGTDGRDIITPSNSLT